MPRQLEITDAAWLAGYIDGDGTLGIYRRRQGRHSEVAISIDSADVEILEYVKAHLGGSLIKKKRYAEHHRQAYIWRCHGSGRVREILVQIFPFMRCAFKKERARMLIEEWPQVVKRNGIYTEAEVKIRSEFLQRFLDVGAGRGKRSTLGRVKIAQDDAGWWAARQTTDGCPSGKGLAC